MNLNLDFLQTSSLTILIIVFIVGFSSLRSKKLFLKSFAANTPSYLTTIGIFFTFLGIFLGLVNFNVENINAAIPDLLSGLKLAFISSVAGLGGSILFRIIKPFRQSVSQSDEVTAGDLLKELSNISEGNVAIKDALVGEGDASLSTQMMKLRTDFRDFAEKVTEDGSSALIKALEEVMRDFNAKINEQFGENFKQLNEAVSSLLVWQKEHKAQVEALTAIFKESQLGIDTVRKNMEIIETSTAKIPEQMSKIEDSFKLTDERMVELHDGLASLSEMREKATDALPHIENQMLKMTDGLQESVNKQMDSLTSMFEGQSKSFAETKEKYDGVLDSLNIASDNLLESTGDVSKEIKAIIIEFQKAQGELSSEFQSTMKDSVNDIEKVLNQSITSVDNSMQETLQRSLDSLANNLTAITSRFVEVYEPFADRVQNIMNKTTDE